LSEIEKPVGWLSEEKAWWLSRGLILLSLLAHLGFIWRWSEYDLAQDEAHYWDWSRHLDWSYYSKGPLVAWIIAGSTWLLGDLSLEWTGTMTAAVRTPAAVFGTFLIYFLVRLGELVFQSRRLGLLIAVASLCIPPIAAVSSIMTIDSPYTASWAGALVCAWWAVKRGGMVPWILLGVLVGVGVLAKYTMVVFLPSLGLFLLFHPDHRGKLLQPGIWVAGVIGLLLCVPIFWWNYQHAGVTFKHVGQLAGVTHDNTRHFLGPLKYLGEQAALLLVYWFVLWLWAMVAHQPLGKTDEKTGYLWWMSAPMFVLFLGFSIRTGGGEVNWPVAAYLAGLPLALWHWVRVYEAGSGTYKRWAVGFLVAFLSLGMGLVLLVHKSDLAYPLMARLVPEPTDAEPAPLRRLDPVCRLRGWRHLAADVDAIRAKLSVDGREPVLAATHWSIPGELGFYCKGNPQAYSIGLVAGDRHSQYDLWTNPIDQPEGFLGRDFIIVGGVPDSVREAFTSIDPVEYSRFKTPLGYGLTNWPIQVGRGFKGFPRKPQASGSY